jgi:cation diffusion facilitator family transporter
MSDTDTQHALKPEAHTHSHEHHSHDNLHSHAEHDHHHDTFWVKIASALHLPGYAHDHGSIAGDAVVYNNALAIRTVKLSLLALGLTTILQVFIYISSGSVALLGDTVHNFGDAANSIPLWIALVLLRRPPTKRFTYGFGRAEDVAGLFIVFSIGFSAVYILWESVQKLINPQPLTNLPWVAAAAIVGFVGNELVALMEIRVGRQIGSAAMVADGQHARTDGLTSLAVLVASGGAALGMPILDPIIGILMGILIVFITRDAAISVWYRLMDAIDPKLTERAEAIIKYYSEVKAIAQLQLRWIGHELHAEVGVHVDPAWTVAQADHLADHLRDDLQQGIPNLRYITIAFVSGNAAE